VTSFAASAAFTGWTPLVQRTKKCRSAAVHCKKGPPSVRRTFFGPDRTRGLGGGDLERQRSIDHVQRMPIYLAI
jgi:hypothetical protein